MQLRPRRTGACCSSSRGAVWVNDAARHALVPRPLGGCVEAAWQHGRQGYSGHARSSSHPTARRKIAKKDARRSLLHQTVQPACSPPHPPKKLVGQAGLDGHAGAAPHGLGPLQRPPGGAGAGAGAAARHAARRVLQRGPRPRPARGWRQRGTADTGAALGAHAIRAQDQGRPRGNRWPVVGGKAAPAAAVALTERRSPRRPS